MKTLFRFGLFLWIILSASASAAPLDLIPIPSGKNSLKPPRSSNDLAVLRYYAGDPDLYSGGTYDLDTIAVVFNPADACSILFVDQGFYQAGMYRAFLWEYSDEAAEISPTGISPYQPPVQPNPPGVPYSPLGTVLAGPFEHESVGWAANNAEQESMISREDLEGGIWLDPPRPFVAGFVFIGDGSELGATPMLNNIYPATESHSWHGSSVAHWDGTHWRGLSDTTSTSTVVEFNMSVTVLYPDVFSPEDKPSQPRLATLRPNYPNPFNASTIIRYSVPAGERFELSVVDLMGRRVAVIERGIAIGSEQSVSFTGPDLPSGVYFTRLLTTNGVHTRKMILLR